MATETRASELGPLTRPATIFSSYSAHSASMDARVGPSVTPAEREAILRSLYAERTPLTRARLLGQLSPEDAAYLADVEAYINQLETAEAADARHVTQSDVLSRLEEIAAAFVTARAAVERSNR